MSPLMPAIISASLAVGLLLVMYAIVKLRTGPDPWVRLERGAQRQPEATPGKKGRKSPLSDKMNKKMSGSGYADKIARRMVQADIKLSPAEFVASRVGAAAIGGVVGYLLALRVGLPPPAGVAVMLLVGYMVPSLVVGYKRKKRVDQFNQQLADSVMMTANSLKAGYSLLQSMDLISRDAPQPTATEFRRVVQEIGVGLSLTDALQNLLRRVPSPDLDLLISAIGIQQDVGGNLSTVLEQIANTIRERVKIKGEVKVLTAQGRASGYVITGLPLIIGVALNIINPEYVKPMWTWPWILMPGVALIMIGIAYFIIQKIVNIEV